MSDAVTDVIGSAPKYPIFRVARPTKSLNKLMHFYQDALGLELIASFDNHEGFDGRILSPGRGAPWHLEFTYMNPSTSSQPPHDASLVDRHSVRSPNPDNLLVIYLPEPSEYEAGVARMKRHGYSAVDPVNPYWADWGVTFEDPDGWRVVLCKRNWTI